MGGNQTLAIVVSVKTRRSSFEIRNWRFSDVLVFFQIVLSFFSSCGGNETFAIVVSVKT